MRDYEYGDVLMRNWAKLSYYFLTSIKRARLNKKMLCEYQNNNIRRIVKYAYQNVPFYRKIYKDLDISPLDIKTKDDLNKLPIIRKEDLKNESETNKISKNIKLKDLITLKTGGSTGEPFPIYIQRKEKDWRLAIRMRANLYCGQNFRDHWVNVENLDILGRLISYRKKIGFFPQTSVPVLWSKSKKFEIINKLNPNVLDGFSGMLWELAREAELRNSKFIHPRIIFGVGEVFPSSSRKYVEEIFNGSFYDQYGCTEFGRTAWECPEKTGYHINADSVIKQFVDKEGEEVGFGERGEMVCTSLFNTSMPLIRFSMNDMAIPIDDECTCEITLPLMKTIEGRKNSFLIFPEENIISPWVFIETMKAFELTKIIDKYRVVQKKKELVEIYVKKSNEHVDEEKIKTFLISNIKEGLPRIENIDLTSVTFEVIFVDDLPFESQQKLNVVYSNVKM